jgi:23S rRNA pseudouridine1911/1915/1917 synthase
MIINYQIYYKYTAREYLSKFYISKSKIYKLFLNKSILINNHIAKETDIINKGDTLSIIYDEDIDYKKSDNNIDILFEDDYFLIVNKKRGIIIHDEEQSLCNDIAKYYYESGISLNIKFPNRIDKDTSGIMIFCKDSLTLSYMGYLFENHDIEKEYRLFVKGHLKNKKGEITYRIGRDRHDSSKMRISSTGKDAITRYEVIKEYGEYSLVKCLIKTGRTHQIRVHMAYIGNPIIGDSLYGNDSGKLLLHAYRIKFKHPIFNENIEIKCKMPEYMEGLE